MNSDIKRLYVVIHVKTESQALQNAEIAFDNGADGIFLINHSISCVCLVEIYKVIRAKYPDEWIGLNMLELTAREAMKHLPSDADGLWTDNAEINENGDNSEPREWFRQFETTHPVTQYFGGVAFKYQRKVVDLEAAVRAAADCMDVICTSGAGTGVAAELDKIRRMNSGNENIQLAIASGITSENIADYLPYADCFLVATGISKSFEWLDPDRVRLLADKIHQFWISDSSRIALFVLGNEEYTRLLDELGRMINSNDFDAAQRLFYRLRFGTPEQLRKFGYFIVVGIYNTTDSARQSFYEQMSFLCQKVDEPEFIGASEPVYPPWNQDNWPVHFHGFGGERHTEITFRINLDCFEEANPIIGFYDEYAARGLDESDIDNIDKDLFNENGNLNYEAYYKRYKYDEFGADVIKGLRRIGTAKYTSSDSRWNYLEWHWQLYKADRSLTDDGTGLLFTTSVGEFRVKICHYVDENDIRILYEHDFCCK